MVGLTDGLGGDIGVNTTPTTFGASVQGGSGVLSSSVRWVEFTTAYVGNPSVVVANMSSVGSAISVTLGSLNPGSFFADGAVAGTTDEFSWIAVGI